MEKESNTMKQKKLLLAGSHAGSTAIAVIEEIKKRNLNWEIHWIGKRFADEGKTTETLEYKNLSKYEVIFHNLESGKIQTKFTKHTLSALLKIPFGFLSGYKLMREINPDLTLSFGSAAGAISAFWSNFMGIPVFIHEQTATAGRANIISSYFCKKILVSRESSFPFFNKSKTQLVGNPTNNLIFENAKKFERNKIVKSILITGGSRGSTWINDAIKPILPRLLERYYVIHQTGDANLHEFDHIKSDKYLKFGQTDPSNMAEIKTKADIIISRAGANTVSDLIVLKKPTILIPIPWTYNDEQQKNAEYMQDLGLARILSQKDLTPQKLLSEIESMILDYPSILKKTESVESVDIQASSNVVDILELELS